MTAIERLVKEWQPARLVVGRPLGEGGAPHEMTRRAERFARQLERALPPAGRPGGRALQLGGSREPDAAAYGARKAATLARGKALDSQAAQLILEQYFDEQQAA